MKSNSIENTPTPFKRPKISSIPKQPKSINQELVNTIKNLSEENSKLKEALADLQNDLKEKDDSIEECQKIINKLKEEYSKVVKEFELLENSYNELLEELNQKTLVFSEHKKRKTVPSFNFSGKNYKKFLLKQNEFKEKKILSSEDIRDINENSNMLNKDNNKNLKKKNSNSVNIIKVKDLIIEKLNLKVMELNDAIKKQNKFNDKNTKKILENIFDKNITHFSYDDLQKHTFILNNNSKYKMPEEVIITNNLKTELIKSEFYSGLIREYHFTNFLQKIFEKIDLSKLKDLYKYIIEHKNNYIKIIQENNLLKRTNKILYKNILELKEKIKINNNEVKNKCINLIENMNKKSGIFHKINIYDIYTNNSNKSYRLKGKNNFSINLSNIDKNKKNVETLKTQINANTIPSLEKADIEEIKKNKYNRQSQDLSYTNKIIITNRINKMINKKKKGIIFNKKEQLDNFLKDNSLEFNNFWTEGNQISEKFNSTNTSLLNKIQLQNSNNKNEIDKLNDFNSIISKSVVQDNLYDSLDEIKKRNKKFIKISIGNSMNSPDNVKYLKTENKKIRNTSNNLFFTSDFFVNLLFKINEGIFVKNEFDKYISIYNMTSFENIYLTFKKTCNELKIMTDEMNLKLNKSHCFTGSNFLNKTNNETGSKYNLESSFKNFNEKIIYLKKFESEFINMDEYIKNYLIAQEATIHLMYKMGKKNIKFEPIDNLFNLFENCLSYRINEMNDNIKFIRKLLIKLFKNQINCLFLSLEYKIK